NPSFTATITGFVNGDNAGVVSGSAGLTTTATPASPAGTFPITAARGSLSAANYTFAFVNGTLTVTANGNQPIRILVTGADAGGGPTVVASNGGDGSPLVSFFPFDQHFPGGVRVAAGDVDGDGKVDLVAGAGAGGGPNVAAFTLRSGRPVPLDSFFAFDP